MRPAILGRVGGGLVLVLHAVVALYYLLTSPPLDLWYDSMPPVGKSSVYVPGSGFSGFWFHLGLLQNFPDLDEYDYYCYSSGCLSLVLSFLEAPVESVAEVCLDIQTSWKAGRLSSYDMVDHFLERLVPAERDSDLEYFLPRINVLVTTASEGVQIRTATNRSQLVDLMIKTTWIPFVTGQGAVRQDSELFLDGGFSRRLHPPCEHTITVPQTWNTFIHTLNPGLDRLLVHEFWRMGQTFGHPVLSGQNNKTTIDAI